MMDWKDYQNISVEDIEQAARGGYWGNLSDSVFPVAINIVSIAASGRKKELNQYFKKNLGHSYYMPRSTRNPAFHFAGSYSDLLEIVAFITRLSVSEVENRLRKFSYNQSKFIHTWTFYSLPEHCRRSFHSGTGLQKEESGHKFMWDYRRDGAIFQCTQEYLKTRMLKWYTKKSNEEAKQKYVQLTLFDFVEPV